MTLGEKISALRTQREWSQGDLAEKMNVSRQSISKWETDGSVPELDKLLLLSQLFDVTLDELVKGDRVSAPEPQPAAVIAQKQGGGKLVVGTILLSFGAVVFLLFAVLGGFLSGLLFSLPFILCGAICLCARKNIGLWCVWALFFSVNIYLRYSTGISWRLTWFTLHFKPSMNYLRLLFAWLELLSFVVMMSITVFRFRKKPLIMTKRNLICYIGSWVALALLQIFAKIPVKIPAAVWFCVLLLDWTRVGVLTSLIIMTIGLLRGRKRHSAKQE